jgi:hypothetical protein
MSEEKKKEKLPVWDFNPDARGDNADWIKKVKKPVEDVDKGVPEEPKTPPGA